MRIPDKTERRSRIDWLIGILRCLLLIDVALVLFLDLLVAPDEVVRLNPPLVQAGLLVFAALYHGGALLLDSRGSGSYVLPLVTLVLDTILTLALIITSGGMESPFLFVAPSLVLTATRHPTIDAAFWDWSTCGSGPPLLVLSRKSRRHPVLARGLGSLSR